MKCPHLGPIEGIWHHYHDSWHAYCDLFVKLAATSQSIYKLEVFAILYLFWIAEIILYLIDDATIMLQVENTQLLTCCLGVIILWRVRGHHFAGLDFPRFSDVSIPLVSGFPVGCWKETLIKCLGIVPAEKRLTVTVGISLFVSELKVPTQDVWGNYETEVIWENNWPTVGSTGPILKKRGLALMSWSTPRNLPHDTIDVLVLETGWLGLG
jgi:hypothetical protein